ncbi:BTB/POZ domain-containing protein KCTD19 isoform X2 [Rhinoderma darwinii]|uniref:BTB/POZ domain-containing protein KCTD19 isoform X2 n=1 Tax=Rhinoderma darwinii TaxID=43563 RepID=UPI003F671677
MTSLMYDGSDAALHLPDLFHFNVGGWVFSIPTVTLSRFGESFLWREVCSFPPPHNTRIFLDRDGFVFRHVHHFLLMAQLSSTCLSDLDGLYEQTEVFHLQPMRTALEKLKEEEPHLRKQTDPDMCVTEEASMNYWKTRKCSSRLSNLPVKSSLFSGNPDKAPLGLLDNPFLDAQEDVHYYFFPIDMLEKYPGLVTDDNLLWFSENFALIECGCPEFQFIGNFLHIGKFFLPEKFSGFEVLEAEIKSLGIPGLLQALHTEKKSSGYAHGSNPETASFSSINTAGSKGELYKATKPFYILALELLAKYPDSALGHLSIESSVDGSKLYIIGTGTLFLHIKNWMGTCKLPLTRSFLEIYGLCSFLDRGDDSVYQPMREAVRSYLKSRTSGEGGILCDSWTADVREFPKHQIVRVYVRSHWYATYLKTLLKYPELLENSRKVRWITCGFSLLVNGDGTMFRHILNFLRLGSLHLPTEFTEWDLLCQEVKEFQIPSLVKALYECKAHRLSVKEHVCKGPIEDSEPEVMSWISSTDLQGEERSQVKQNIQENITAISKGLTHNTLKRDLPSPDLTLNDFSHRTKIWKVDETVDNCTEHTAILCLIKQVSESSARISICNECPTVTTAHNEENTLKQHTAISDWGLLCHNITYENSGGEIQRRGEIQQDGSELLGSTQRLIPAYEAIRQQSPPIHQNLLMHHDYSKLSQAMSPTEEAPRLGMEREGSGDLGAVLWVQHHHLLANDGCSTSFQDSVIYTTEMDLPRCAECTDTAEDVIFLTFNMSHKEISYARQCHSFLTGITFDCIQQGDPKLSVCTVMRLVSMFWAFQIPGRQFVDDLMLLQFYKGKKSTRKTLRCWLEFSLPYARRYSQCINMMLQQGHHRSASCITLRTLLQ